MILLKIEPNLFQFIICSLFIIAAAVTILVLSLFFCIVHYLVPHFVDFFLIANNSCLWLYLLLIWIFLLFFFLDFGGGFSTKVTASCWSFFVFVVVLADHFSLVKFVHYLLFFFVGFGNRWILLLLLTPNAIWPQARGICVPDEPDVEVEEGVEGHEEEWMHFLGNLPIKQH